ncbi:uncharacterized protein LOC106011878 [Aplysia californica]|uniref:Uncharacterized protein LOC106011878 n=1 Tax=Aplysia californica TaxID=6500 RepID=A0ABM1A0Q5_APLCA|nr:uncharacterized protein LOC106011878 [Aplysia californica]
MKVITPSHVHNLDLTRASRVLHESVRVISVEPGDEEEEEFRISEIDPDLHLLDGNFFENHSTGTILSIHKRPDGKYHVEGHLSHSIVIAPPGSGTRHKRSTGDHKGHFVYTTGAEDYDRDLSGGEAIINVLNR